MTEVFHPDNNHDWVYPDGVPDLLSRLDILEYKKQKGMIFDEEFVLQRQEIVTLIYEAGFDYTNYKISRDEQGEQ